MKRHSKSLIHIVCAAVLVLASFQIPSQAQITPVTLDPAKSQGTWDGWGTALCWWAKVFGNRDDIADLLFTTNTVDFNGQKLPGLGLTIARYNVGACSWNEVDGHKMVVSRTILPYRQMEGYWLDGKSDDPQSKSWDWTVDANQRAMLQKVRDRGANYFELFSNSPMWWMCGNDNPSGNIKPVGDNLPPENYEKFAIYLATTAKYAKENWGISFTTVEPFNEPGGKWWVANGKQEGCSFSNKAQAAILPLVRRELDQRGLKDMPISMSDQNTYDQAVTTWKSFDDSTKALINQVNVHGYQLAKGQRDLLAQITTGKRLWNSEYGEIESTGLKLSQNLQLDFHLLHPTAWCYWQPFDHDGWGFINTDLPHKIFHQVNPKYFVVAQYTRHIRPGMTILTTGEAETVAAYDLKGHKLVIIVQNLGDNTKDKTYDLAKFAVEDESVSRWITEPNGKSRYEQHDDARVTGKRLEINLPAHSVQTLEIPNITP